MSTQPLLLSSVYGKIEQVLLVQPGFSTAYSDLPMRRICDDYEAHGIKPYVLKNRLDTKVQDSIARRKLAFDDPVVANMLARGRAAVIEAKFDLRLWSEELFNISEKGIPLAHSEWAQDGFCVQAYDTRYNLILQPLHSRRFVDQFISFDLALERELDLLIKPTLLELEGGNILVGDRFALIGKNTLGANWISRLVGIPETTRSDQNALEAEFESLCQEIRFELGVDSIIWVGYSAVRRDLFDGSHLTYQPDFHIDLFLTLGGKTNDGDDLLLIGDPRLGNQLLEQYLGIAVAHDLTWEDDPITDEFVFDSFFDAMDAQFADYNATQSERRFKIIQLPMLIDRGIVYSYNNCLVEQYGDQLRAILPNYVDDEENPAQLSQSEKGMNAKFEILNQEVEQILKSNGFTNVIWVGGGRQLKHFARSRGSLHCLTKVLRRSNYDLGARD